MGSFTLLNSNDVKDIIEEYVKISKKCKLYNHKDIMSIMIDDVNILDLFIDAYKHYRHKVIYTRESIVCRVKRKLITIIKAIKENHMMTDMVKIRECDKKYIIEKIKLVQKPNHVFNKKCHTDKKLVITTFKEMSEALNCYDVSELYRLMQDYFKDKNITFDMTFNAFYGLLYREGLIRAKKSSRARLAKYLKDNYPKKTVYDLQEIKDFLNVNDTTFIKKLFAYFKEEYENIELVEKIKLT